MSLGKRIFDLARANLNALLDRTGGDGLDDMSDEELEAELERRRERRRQEDAERRARDAAEREARERAATRAAQAGAQRVANRPSGAASNGAASGNANARGASGNTSNARGSGNARGNSSGGNARGSAASPRLSEKRLRDLYAQLETPYGAPFDEVKKSFRRLMRKYHPDLHVNNPQKHKAATQLTMSLTQAYNELEQHLTKR